MTNSKGGLGSANLTHWLFKLDSSISQNSLGPTSSNSFTGSVSWYFRSLAGETKSWALLNGPKQSQPGAWGAIQSGPGAVGFDYPLRGLGLVRLEVRYHPSA